MRIRSVAAIAVATLIGGALVAGPAQSAQTVTVKPEVFAGAASARALDINVLGQRLTFGDTFAKAAKSVTAAGESVVAEAAGAGQLSLLGNTTQTAKVSGIGTQANPEKCAPVALPAAVANILSVGVACSASSASAASGAVVNAVSSGNVAGIDLSANTVLSTLPIGTLADTLLAVVPNLPIDVKTPVKELVDSVLKTKTLDVSVGDAVSEVKSTTDTVTARANSAAVTIKLLPAPDLKGVIQSQPIITITAAQASAKVIYDRITGAVLNASFDPALVRVQCTLAVLCNGLSEIVVAPNQDIELGKPGDLLHVRIAAASGRIIDDPVLGKKAVSDGVAIQLLDGLQGGIQLNLAHAEAGAIVVPGKTTVLDIPNVEISRSQLPRTGAEDVLPLAIAAVAVMALAGRRLRLSQR